MTFLSRDWNVRQVAFCSGEIEVLRLKLQVAVRSKSRLG